MSLTRHDPAIAAWLADGPTELSSTTRRSIGEHVRTTRQDSSALSWLPGRPRGRLLALVGLVVAVVLTVVVAAGASRLVRPQPTPPPPAILPMPTGFGAVSAVCWDAASTVTLPAQGSVTLLPGEAVALDYSLPEALHLEGGVAGSVVGFGTPFAFPYHLDRDGTEEEFVAGSHGLVVTDVSRAVRHGSLERQPRIGSDAETFLRELDVALPYQNTVIDFEVDDVAATELAGMPAWTARVSVPDLDPPMWSHIDDQEGEGRGCAVEFSVPNRVWVMDVGSSIVLVQAWASDDAVLEAWLPQATRLVDTFRFRPEAS